MSSVVRHLTRQYGMIYAWFWLIMSIVLMALMMSLDVFGPWVIHTSQMSAWQTAGTQAPMWFLFVMGTMIGSAGLPVIVANGITRREYAAGVGIFALGSSVLFGLLTLVGQGVEILVYRADGIMDVLTAPYPMPTPATLAQGVLARLAFMLTGCVIALSFYRMRVWWAILLAPVAMFPVAAALDIAYTGGKGLGPLTDFAAVVVAGTVAYLLVRTVPIKPKKA